MSRRLLIGLAPVLAIWGFFVMPTAAQAAPHWYANGAIVGELPVPTISWGTLAELGNKGSGGGETECHVVAGGFVKNPGGGAAGEGKTQEFAYDECSGNIPCAPGHQQARAVPGSLQGASGGWPSKLEEPKAGEIRVNTTGEEIEIGCLEPPEFKEFKGAIAATSATALQNPLGPSGSRKGTGALAPGTTVFDENTGELEIPKQQPYGKVRTTGTLKTLGYEEQELINIKSP